MVPISVQLYSAREEMSADLMGTLKQIAEMGYAGVEPAGFYDLSAADINVVCDKLEAVGMTMFMHNHNGEFEAKFDGRSLFDTLFEMCPKLQTETDIYWVQVGGEDPAGVISRYKSRMPLMHVKDGPISPASPMTAVGQGKVDVAACIAAAEGGALTWAVVELDEAEGDMMEALKQSHDFLTSNGLAKGTK